MIHLPGIQAVSFRALIVGADVIQNEIIARCVEMLGWTADVATTAEDARKTSRRAGVVVLGHIADPCRFLRDLRANHAHPTLIFIAGTGDRAAATLSASMRTARDLGLRVAGTLPRPVDPYRLHALLLADPPTRRVSRGRQMPPPAAADLERALREGEIHTEFQPKTDLATGAFVGAEALVRWRSPAFGLIPPEQFVALAEQSDLIAPLTFRVLADAIAACRRWREVRPDCDVAVNLSPHVLRDARLPGAVDLLLEQHRLPPRALIVEVTEPALLSNLPAATEMLSRLALRGVRISIDDYGTGHSSIRSLLRMPFAELKIDRSFVSICRTDMDAWVLVRATIALARELGIQVVAEGIESADISDRLRDVGCDTGQGWYFGRPVRDAAIRHWLTPADPDVAADRMALAE